MKKFKQIVKIRRANLRPGSRGPFANIFKNVQDRLIPLRECIGRIRRKRFKGTQLSPNLGHAKNRHRPPGKLFEPIRAEPNDQPRRRSTRLVGLRAADVDLLLGCSQPGGLSPFLTKLLLSLWVVGKPEKLEPQRNDVRADQSPLAGFKTGTLVFRSPIIEDPDCRRHHA